MFQIHPIAESTLAALLAVCIGLLIVPIAKKWGRRFGLVDTPDQKRKLHSRAIPLVGGIAIFLSVLIAIPVVAIISNGFSFFQLAADAGLQGLLLASIIILLVGIVDDRFNIRGRQKLIGQFIAASVLVFFDYQFDIISVFGIDFQDEKPVVYYVVAYAWILIGINSVNLLDGADGFASTIGVVTCTALCVMAIGLALAIPDLSVNELADRLQVEDGNSYNSSEAATKKAETLLKTRSLHLQDAVICAIMAGSILAFLKFNFPPATAFLGDAGSMLIGLFISAMAIKTGAKQATAYAFLAPIALLAIPLFDTLAAIVRRKLTGRSIYDTDRGHLHHALIGKGFGPRKSLLLFFAMCLMTATGGTMALIYKQAEYAVLAILSVAVFLVVGRIFGIAEFKLISHSSSSIFRAMLPTTTEPENSARHTSFRLQGNRDWEICWEVLREFAESHRINQLSLDLNLPWIHESFHGKYKSENKSLMDDQWSLELPLIVEDRSVGTVKLQASARISNYGKTSLELEAALNSLQPYIVKTMKEHLSKMSEDLDDIVAEQQSIEFGGLASATKDAGRS